MDSLVCITIVCRVDCLHGTHITPHTVAHGEASFIPLCFETKMLYVVGHINRLDCILLRMRFSLYPRRPKTPRLTSPRRAIYVGPRRRTGLARPRGAVRDMCGALAPPAAPSAPVGGRVEGRFFGEKAFLGGRAPRSRRFRGREAASGRRHGPRAPPGTPTDRWERRGGAAAAGSGVGARGARLSSPPDI